MSQIVSFRQKKINGRTRFHFFNFFLKIMLFQNCCNQSRNDAISDDRLYCKTDVISNSREMMQGTESEKFIRLITWDDFRVVLCITKVIRASSCRTICGQPYFPPRKGSAMCDNFKGWDNYSINELGIVSNVCLPRTAPVKCIIRLSVLPC